MVKMFHGFPKPQNKFIRDMVYGIQATGDTIITDIARDRPRDDLLHRRVARTRREKGRPRRAHRAHAPEIQRGAGVLPLCARCRNQAGVRALRKLGDESRGQEEGRQTADAAGMGRAVVPRRRIARGRAKRRGVLRVRKPGAASVGETCARNQRFCRGRAG